MGEQFDAPADGKNGTPVEGEKLEPLIRIKMQLSPDRSVVPGIRELVYRTALNHGCGKQDAFDWKLIAGEALSAIVLRSEKHGAGLPFHIELFVYPGYLEIRFRDYLPEKYRPERKMNDLSDYREGGVGLYLISKLSDYHFYNDSHEHGSELVVKKRK